MHKFTIFTILLSIIVIFVVTELVLNDYMSDDFAKQESQIEEQVTEETPVTTEEPVITDDTEIRGDEETAPATEEESIPTFAAHLTQDIATQAGASQETPMVDIIVTTSPYDGLVYGFWDTSTEFADLTILTHKLFDGATYLGTIYEIQPSSAIDLFTTYETLKTIAKDSATGTLNENNSYGQASFYFNHATKTNTVFLVVRQNEVIYALEYSHDSHPFMRTLIGLL